MLRYVIKRLLMMIPVILGISIIVFVVMRMIPGDPAVIMFGDETSVGQGGSEAELERIRDNLGLNDPLPVQYLRWIQQLAQGDFGNSLIDGTPVIDGILQRMPATMQLALASVLLALLIAVPLGVASAVHQGRFIDRVGLVVASLSVSVPSFWIALMLIVLFSVTLGWLPTGGRPETGLLRSCLVLFSGDWRPAWEWVLHSAMPVSALAFSIVAPLVRITRYSLLEVLRADYIRTARAKGLSERSVLARHAMRAALIPIVTVIGLQFAYLLSGTVLIETIFRWPGIGRLGYVSIRRQDYPTVQGVILIVAFLFSIVNLLIDILYSYLDPRIRYD